MDINDVDFETWFEILQEHLADNGVRFEDEDAVRGDYNEGKDLFDVRDEILKEYGVESEY